MRKEEFEALGILSIHASAKEATLLRDSFLMNPVAFNPRLREGGDQSGGER